MFCLFYKIHCLIFSVCIKCFIFLFVFKIRLWRHSKIIMPLKDLFYLFDCVCTWRFWAKPKKRIWGVSIGAYFTIPGLGAVVGAAAIARFFPKKIHRQWTKSQKCTSVAIIVIYWSMIYRHIITDVSYGLS